jgi:hypothetical protein
MERAGAQSAGSDLIEGRAVHETAPYQIAISEGAGTNYTDRSDDSIGTLGNGILPLETGRCFRPLNAYKSAKSRAQTTFHPPKLLNSHSFRQKRKPVRSRRTTWWSVLGSNRGPHHDALWNVGASTSTFGKRNFARRDCRTNSTDEPSNYAARSASAASARACRRGAHHLGGASPSPLQDPLPLPIQRCSTDLASRSPQAWSSATGPMRTTITAIMMDVSKR